ATEGGVVLLGLLAQCLLIHVDFQKVAEKRGTRIRVPASTLPRPGHEAGDKHEISTAGTPSASDSRWYCDSHGVRKRPTPAVECWFDRGSRGLPQISGGR